MNRRLALSLLSSLAVLVAGCGFHLQGASDLPGSVDRVHVVTRDELSAFSVELFHGLERAGVQRVASVAEADAVIRVRTDQSRRRVLSVSARNTPQEFEIVYQVVYSIEAGGSEVVPPQTLELTRSITFDESQLLAKDREEEILRDAMARQLAELVLRRLASLPHAPAVQSDPSR